MQNLIYDATMLVDGETSNNSRSGIYFVSLNILRELSKRSDFNVFLWAPPHNYASLEDLIQKLPFPIKNLYHKSAFACNVSSFSYKLRIRAEKTKNKFLRKALFALTISFEKIEDVVLIQRNFFHLSKENYSFFSPVTVAPWYFHRQKGIQKFVILYDLIPFKLQEYHSHQKKGWFGRLIKRINSIDVYFPISEATKNDFCSRFHQIPPNHIKTVYLAANDSFQRTNDPTALDAIKSKYKLPLNKKYVFSLCTLEPRKNLVRAVRTFVQFIEKNNISDLIWIMGGAEWNRFSSAIKDKLNNPELFDKCVFYAGYIDDKDLPALYSNAEWFVYTSQYEGFGLPPLEAMQCGCPVITSNNSSLPEVVGNAGIMIDWDSDEQHVAAYEKYYFNEELRKENSQKGLERAKQFSWKKTTEKMVRIMEFNK